MAAACYAVAAAWLLTDEVRHLCFFIKLSIYMKIKTLFLSALLVMISGCASPKLPDSSQLYNPENSARIRLFGQNQKPSIMIVHTDHGTDSKTMKINVGGNLGDAFTSLVGVAKNESIGIAETENTQNLKSRDGILSKAFYREFIIPAGKPVQVQNAFIGLTNVQRMPGMTMTHHQKSCSSATVSFTPQAGKDYEVGTYKNGNFCSVVVFEIQTLAGQTTLVPVQADD